MKNCHKVGLIFLWVLCFSLSTYAEAEIENCSFMEGITLDDQQREALLSGSCTSCQCVQESFIHTDLSELKNKYHSELGEVLRLRFSRRKIPEFVQQMKEFDTLQISCGLDRLNEVPCGLEGELKDEVEGIFAQYFNREKQSSCFPVSAISRGIKYEKLNSDLEMIKMMLENGASVEDFDDSDPVIAIYKENFETLKDIKPSYDELKSAILTKPELKASLTEQVQSKCTKFFDRLDAAFCEEPKILPLEDKLLSNLLGFNKSKSFPVKATYRDLELFTLSCQTRACKEEKAERPAQCSNLDSQKGYELSSIFPSGSNLFNEDAVADQLDYKQQRYENYCPLLKCQDIDDAMLVVYGEKDQCQELDSPRDMEEMLAELSCESDSPKEICEKDMLAELIKYYDPKKDDPLPPPEQLLGGRSYDDVSIEEKKQILKDHGYSEQALNFLGDVGLKRAFGQKLKLEGEPLTAEQREFRELGRESARELEAQRQAERERQVTQKTQENEGPSFSERFASSKQKQKPKASDVRSSAQKRVYQRPTQQATPTNYLNPIPEVEQARGQRTLERLSDQVRSKRERGVDNDYQSLEGKIRQLRQEAEEIRDERERKAYEDEIARLENQVEELEQENLGQRGGLERRPRNFSDVGAGLDGPRNRIPQDFRVPQEEKSGPESDKTTASSTGEASPSQQNLNSSATGPNGRSPASIDQSESYENLSNGEAARYLERSSEELPLLSLENLGEVTPGESFILGVRELEGLKRIEMLPENSGDQVLYRAVMDEGLSDEAKSSLLQSPFFQQYAHPDVKNELMQSLQESARHHDLIELLGEQL